MKITTVPEMAPIKQGKPHFITNLRTFIACHPSNVSLIHRTPGFQRIMTACNGGLHRVSDEVCTECGVKLTDLFIEPED